MLCCTGRLVNILTEPLLQRPLNCFHLVGINEQVRRVKVFNDKVHARVEEQQNFLHCWFTTQASEQVGVSFFLREWEWAHCFYQLTRTPLVAMTISLETLTLNLAQ